MVPGNAAKLGKMGSNFTKTTFATYSRITGKCRNQTFFTGWCPGTVSVKQTILNFNSGPLTFDLGWFPAKNSQNRAKNNKFFLEKQEEICPWFCDIWIALWLKFFGYLQGETGSQSWTKSANFGYLPFPHIFEFFKDP